MKKEIKGFVCGVILTVLLGCGVSAAGIWDNISVLRNDITVIVNGNEVAADNFLYNDTTYLPMRVIGEALGKDVQYDEETNTAKINDKGAIPIDNNMNNTTNKNKYIPPQDMFDKEIIEEENGIYYIIAGLKSYFNDYFDGINAWYDVNLERDELLEHAKNQEPLEYVFHLKNGMVKTVIATYSANQGRYLIPYDTFMEEIYPYIQ